MYFGNDGVPKTWLHKCLKSPFSEDPSKSNMVNRPQTLFEFERQHLYHIY